MSIQIIPCSTTLQPKRLRLFVGRDDRREVELGRIKFLVDEWLVLREESPADAAAIRRKEDKLHSTIKASHVYGRVLNFAGLNLWVDDRSPDGVVEMQEAINL